MRAHLTIISLVLFSLLVGDCRNDTMRGQTVKPRIGALVDLNSHIGKQERVAMELAVLDFYGPSDQGLTLQFRNSSSDPIKAASYAKKLIYKNRVNGIIGFRTWEEANSVAELGNNSQVPILCLANDMPKWASRKWLFLLNAARSQYAQVKAVAAIIKTWQWRRVTIIYEDTNTAKDAIIPYLITAIHEVESDIDALLPIPPSPPYYLLKTLEKIKEGQTRVFIVHITSITLASCLFKEAKMMGMMGKEFVWITTNDITNQVDSLNESLISSMQGVLGIKSCFPKQNKRYHNFSSQFLSMFRFQYPNEPYTKPGISAVQAYDAVWAVAMAMGRKREHTTPLDSITGQQLLYDITKINFMGLDGNFTLVDGALAPGCIFCVINVVGKSYREIGYWSDGLGFSTKIRGNNISYNESMRILGQVYWPGGPWSTPRGWAVPTNSNPIKIGVPARPTFSEFVNVKYDKSSGEPVVEGFCIDVFKATIELLPYNLTYKFVPVEGPLDSLVAQVHEKKYGAVVGDTAAVANRYAYAEFSLRYTDPGIQMVVNETPRRSGKAWLFKKPFTTLMWIFTAFISLYNGFVVWSIERNNNPYFKGTFFDQSATTIWLSFTTLFSSFQGDHTVKSNLSRMAMVVWLFVALVITSSYIASLTSMLTIQGLKPTPIDVDTLVKSNAKVGCNANSFISKYLEEVLHFDTNNIVKIYSEDDYPQALKNGEIAAAFLQVPYVKVFLAKHCNGFTTAGPTFKVGGFGFAFPRGSPMLPDFSKAILTLSEKGILQKLESSLTSSHNCSASASDDNSDSLGIDSFWALFFITGVASTIALLISVLSNFCIKWPLISRKQALFKAYMREDHEEDESVFYHKHGPNEDEKIMFASEMRNQYSSPSPNNSNSRLQILEITKL